MNCKLFGKTAVFLMMLAICLLFAPAASAAGTTGGSGSYTYYNDSFKLPADVTNIEEEAFCGCAGMTGIVIPGTVSSIGRAAFHGCSSLTDVYYHGTREQWNALSIGTDNSPLQRAEIHFVVDAGNLANLTWVLDDTGKLTISGTGEMPDFGNPKDPKVYDGPTFPQCITAEICPGVESIGNYAFCYYSSLESVTIPSSVTRIGQYAFLFCSELTSVTIPDSVTSIEAGAFAGCSGLTSVTIPSSVTSIGGYAFSYCSRLTEIYVDDSHPAYCSINGVLFNKDRTCLLLFPAGKGGYYSVPEGVTSIGESAFVGCSGLTSVMIPESVTSIGDSAFRYCESLESVTIPSSVTSIGNGVFNYCESLKSVTIPEGVTSIGESAFGGCSGLTSVMIPESVTSIGDSAFRYCESLKSVTIPSSVTSIGSSAFYNCAQLESVTIPSSVTSIGNSAFYNCAQLESVTIPSSVTSIDDYTFSRCNSLQSVTIPSSVTSIGGYAFSYCSSLQSVLIPSSVTSIGRGSFSNADNLSDVYYEGTQEQWQTITIGTNNNALTTAAIHTVDQTFEIISFTRNPGDGKVTGTTSGGTIPNQFTLTVTASEDNLTYTWKWRENGASAWQDITSVPMFIWGETNLNTLEIHTENPSLNGHSYEFKCTVSKGYLNVDTNIVNIYVVNPDGTTPAAPVITEHPKSITASGGTAVFKVTAEGSNLSYQWQYRESANSSWKNAADTGSKTAQLTVSVTNSKNGYQYRCAVSNAGGTVYSNSATLTVPDPEGTAPVITGINLNPPDHKATPSQSGGTRPNMITILVTATGDNLTYSWKWREKGGNNAWNDLSTIGTVPMICYDLQSNPVTIYLYDETIIGHTYEFKCVVTSGDLSTESDTVYVEMVGPV